MVAAGDICDALLPWYSPLNHLEEHLTASWLQFLGRALLMTDPQLPHEACKRPPKIHQCLTDTLLLVHRFGVSEWQTLLCMKHFPSSIKQNTWSIRRKYVFRMDTGFRSPKNHSCFLPWRPIDLCHLLFQLEPELVIHRKTILFPIGFISFCTSKRTVLF